MNKKNLAQIRMYLNGLLSRMETVDGRENFVGITIQFKSGTVSFPAELNICGERVEWNHAGRQDIFQIDKMEEVTRAILNAAEKYDKMKFKYIENSKTVVITADDKNVKMSSESTNVEIEKLKRNIENSHIGNREYIIKAGEADDLLKCIGIMAPNGKIKNDMIRKYNQIDHFVEILADNLNKLAKTNKQITVLDCACGKSYLSFVLNFYIKNILRKPCKFIGIDYSETVIEASKKMARDLRYNNMEFVKADLTDYNLQEQIDICISLHACDTATDMAIACALKSNASMIVAVPCCHKELLSQYNINGVEPLLEYGILKARISDAVTDGLRANYLEALGYETRIIEYISPLETPKNIMIKAYKKNKINHDMLDEYKKLCLHLNVTPALSRYYNI